MTLPVRSTLSTPLEAEYRELVRQSATEKRSAGSRTNLDARKSGAALPEDVVTLSTDRQDVETPKKLKPSQSVTLAEKQALYVPFSVYG